MRGGSYNALALASIFLSLTAVHHWDVGVSVWGLVLLFTAAWCAFRRWQVACMFTSATAALHGVHTIFGGVWLVLDPLFWLFWVASGRVYTVVLHHIFIVTCLGVLSLQGVDPLQHLDAMWRKSMSNHQS